MKFDFSKYSHKMKTEAIQNNIPKPRSQLLLHKESMLFWGGVLAGEGRVMEDLCLLCEPCKLSILKGISIGMYISLMHLENAPHYFISSSSV